MRPHFAHQESCRSAYHYHAETRPHRDAKVFLATHLRTAFAEYSQATIEYEVPIPEIQRVADLMATFPNGWRVAHDIQLSSIKPEEIQKRTDEYAKAGIDLVWWLGKGADNAANRDFCLQTFGYVLRLQVHE